MVRGGGSRIFLTSHAVDHDRAWVARFHSDLEHELRVRTSSDVRGDLSSAHAASHALASAATLPAMVAVISDAFFRDAACGQRWSVFTARIRLDEARWGRDAGACIVPVLWRQLVDRPPPGAVLPGEDLALRSQLGGPGLYERMRLHRNVGGDPYLLALRDVASRVLQAYHRHLSEWPLGRVDRLTPAFGTDVGREMVGPGALPPAR